MQAILIHDIMIQQNGRHHPRFAQASYSVLRFFISDASEVQAVAVFGKREQRVNLLMQVLVEGLGERVD